MIRSMERAARRVRTAWNAYQSQGTHTKPAIRQALYGTAVHDGRAVEYYFVTALFDCDVKKYGILVTMGDEWVMLPSLSVSWRRVEELLSRMMRGCVTPVAVQDVVADWLAE